MDYIERSQNTIISFWYEIIIINTFPYPDEYNNEKII